MVPVGTPVRLINEPVKMACVNGELRLEAHPPVDAEGQTYEPNLELFSQLLDKSLGSTTAAVHWDFAREALQKADGMPTVVGLEADLDQPAQQAQADGSAPPPADRRRLGTDARSGNRKYGARAAAARCAGRAAVSACNNDSAPSASALGLFGAAAEQRGAHRSRPSSAGSYGFSEHLHPEAVVGRGDVAASAAGASRSITMRTSCASDDAPIFSMTRARWISTVR